MRIIICDETLCIKTARENLWRESEIRNATKQADPTLVDFLKELFREKNLQEIIVLCEEYKGFDQQKLASLIVLAKDGRYYRPSNLSEILSFEELIRGRFVIEILIKWNY